MKKLTVILLLIILMVGCSYKKPYIEIKYDEFTNKLENKESFIFYIGSSTCSFCDRYDVALKKVVDKYEVEVYYIDTNLKKIGKDNYKNLSNIINFSGTPHTVFIKDGEISSSYNSIEGAVSSEKIIEAFKRNGYIK